MPKIPKNMPLNMRVNTIGCNMGFGTLLALNYKYET